MASPEQTPYVWDLVNISPTEAKRIGFDWDAYSREDDRGRKVIDRDKIRNNMRGSEASALISGMLAYMNKNWTWKPTAKKSVVAEFMYRYAVDRDIKYISRGDYPRVLRYLRAQGLDLQSEFRPMVYSRNIDGGRIPVDMHKAEDQFLRDCSAVKPFVNKRLTKQEQQEEQQEEKIELEDIEQNSEDERENMLDELDEEFEQEHDGSGLIEMDEEFPHEALDLLQRIKNAHHFAADRNIDGMGMDFIAMRAFEDAARLFVLGVPADLIFSNIIQHWSVEEKRTIWQASGMAFNNGIYMPQHQQENEPWDIDPQTFQPKVDVPGLEFIDPKHHHKALKLLLTMMHARIPTLCWGGSGTGKTTAYRHAAECLRQSLGYKIEDYDAFPFGFLSMTRGTAPSAFNGRPMITNTAIMIEFMYAQAEQNMARMKEIADKARAEGDVIISIWEKVYTGGGVMLLDEIDAGDENLILLVNAAIANGHFANTATGKLVEKHPDFIIGFAGNTNGMGANKLHGARNRLDHATLDRVRLGRIPFMLDMELAETTYREIIMAGR